MEKYKRLSTEDREQISILLEQGYGYAKIAQSLGRSPSTIGREIYRNGDRRRYRAFPAHQKATERQRYQHQQTIKIERDPSLKAIIMDRLKLFWSPKLISLWLKKEHNMSISHEAIYQYIYIRCKGELKKELISYLRQSKPKRQNRKNGKDKRGIIPDMVSIHDRPKEVEQRTIPGHWEGDLIMGKDHKSAIGTLVERQSRYVIIVRLKKKDATTVRKEFAKKIMEMPKNLRLTLTYDRGKEMTEHKQFTIDTKIQVYFCDPASPSQRGTNENTNGLIRKFFPKGTDFNQVKPSQIQWAQDALNERPRILLDLMTPKEALNLLISNG